MPKFVASSLAPPRDKSAHFRVILSAFAALGLHVGVWATLIVDLAGSLGIGVAALGVALTFQSVAGMVFLLFGGRVADRFGRRVVLVAGAAGTGIYLALLALVKSYPALLAVLAFSGTASLYDLASNSLGGDYERLYDERAMTLFHAAFSGSAALGALGSGAALGFGVDFEVVYLFAGGAVFAFAVASLRLPLPRHISETEEETPERNSWRMRDFLRVPAVLVCAAVIFLCFSTDAALEGYTSIYLRDLLGAGALAGGVGLASLYLAGALSRLFGAAAISRFGDRSVLVASGALAALGLGVVISTGKPSVAALGLLLVGVALAPVAPILASTTSRAAPTKSAQAISLVITSGYLAFTISPVLAGGIAEISSLRFSFALLLFFCLVASVLAWRMPE